MTSIGTGYDLSASTYSPEGRIFQVEYAGKAVEKSGVVVGLRVRDGIVFGVEKLTMSKMMVSSSNKRIYNIDTHVGMAVAGFAPDARQIVNRAREECQNYRGFYGDAVPIKHLNDRLSLFVQAHTLYGYIRPFGTSVILGGVDHKGPQLFMIEPSGVSYGYYGCAIGKGRELAKTEMEKLNLKDMTAREALKAVAAIVYKVNDEAKEFELELSWISPESGNKHQLVPEQLRTEAIDSAKAAMDAGDDDEEDDQ